MQSKDQTAAGVASAETRVSKLSQVIDKHRLAWSAAGASISTALGFLSDAARAGAEDEASEKRLAQAVDNTGTSFDKVKGKIDERIKKGMDLGFSDDQIRDSLTTLTNMTGSHEEALKRQTAAMDLARGAHIDLGTASKLLGKIDDDHVKLLGRLGIHIPQVTVSEQDHAKALDEVKRATLEHDKAATHLAQVQTELKGKTHLTADEQLKLRDAQQKAEDSTKKLDTAQQKAKNTTKDGATETAAFGEIQKRYGGQAQTYGDTTAGAMDKVKNKLQDFKEEVGKNLGPMQGVVGMLPGISTGFTAIGAVAGPLAQGLSKTAAASRLAAIGMALLNLALGPVGLILLGIGLAIGLLALAWSNNWGDIQGKTKVAIEVISGIFNGFKNFIRTLWNTIIDIIYGAINTALGILNILIRGWNTVAKALGLPILGEIKVNLPNLHWAEDQINKTARDRDTYIRAKYVDDQGRVHTGQKAFAAGGSGTVYGPTLFLAGEAGPERYNFTPIRSGMNSDSSAGSGPVMITTHIHLELDERELAHVVDRRLVQQLT